MTKEENFKEKAQRLRKERTAEIARLVKEGEYTPVAFNARASWFPPRPIIKKDGAKVRKLHEVLTDG